MNREELIQFMEEAERRGDMESAKSALAELETMGSVQKKSDPLSQVMEDYSRRTSRVMEGMMDPIHGAAQLLSNALPENVSGSVNRFNNAIPFMAEVPPGGMDEMIRSRESEIMQSNPSGGFDWARLGGNILSPVNLIPAIRAARTTGLLGKIGYGAGTGGLLSGMQPVAEGDFTEEKAKQVGLGMAGGAALPMLASGLSRVVKPQTKEAIRQMMSEGVTPTPGQIIGGPAKRIEEASTVLPVFGDMIKRAKFQQIEDFNRAAINRALLPIGKKATDIGYKGIEKAHYEISRSYDDLLPTLNIKPDRRFFADIGDVWKSTNEMVPQRANQVARQIEEIVSKMENMTPDVMKQIDSKLGRLASDGFKKPDLDQQQAAEAFRYIQTALRKMVERANPEKAGQLARINEAYANLLRVENAASLKGAKEGIFTPNQLESATRAMDSSLRKRASAHGQALMQDLATAGESTIGSKLPSSGTTERALLNIGTLATGGMLNPAIPVGLLGASGLYTKPAQKLIASALTSRPDAADPIAKSIMENYPYLMGGMAGLLGPQNR